MKLARVAAAFDDQALSDAYSGAPLFKGQFDVFDDSRRDAYGVERRVLSVAPDVQRPARSAISEPARGEVWLMGVAQADYFRGRVIRQKFILHRAKGLAEVKTPGQVLGGVAGVQAYASPSWTKDAKDAATRSNPAGIYSVFFALDEPVLINQVIYLDGLMLWAYARHESSAGFTVLEAEEISGRLQAVQYKQHTFDPVKDIKALRVTPCQALVLRWQTLYENNSDAALKMEVGDRVAVVRKADVPAPTVGNTVVGAYTWEVLAVEDRGDVWALQVRMG